MKMHQRKYKLGLIVLSVLAVSVLAAGSVSAEKGSGRDGSAPTTTVKTETEVETEAHDVVATTTSSSGEVENETNHEAVTTKLSDLRDRADKVVQTERTNQKPASTVEGRQKACKAREANLNNKIANYDKQAKRHLAAYDAAYKKLQAFQADKQLTVADYDALITAADAKKAAATDAVSALDDVSVKIDCTATDPAQAVATVKTAVANAKQALKEYRTSVKNVLVALMTAKSAADGDSTDDSTDTTNTTEGTN